MSWRPLAVAFIVAYLATVSVVLGVLGMTMIAHLTTATWFGAVRRRAESVIASLPVLAVLSVPLLIAVLALAPPVSPGNRPQAAYLHTPFLIARAVVYWIAWLAIAESLRSASRLERRGDVARAARRFRDVSAVGLVVLAFTMTFASFDWMLALTPEWYSTAFGVYWFSGALMGALALLAVLAHRASGSHPTASQFQSLGKLMLTLVMFWVYIGFAQYIVIWSANIPREVAWHVPRTHGGWGVVALILLLGAAAAFLALILLAVKRHGAALAAVGGLLLALHYLDTCWMVIPGVVPVSPWLVVLSAVAVLVVVGAAIGGARLRRLA